MKTKLATLLPAVNLLTLLCCAEPRVKGVQYPQLPEQTPNATLPTVTGKSIAVHSGGDVQAAINEANCGDQVVLDQGVTWQGNYTLQNKGCSGALNGGWVIVRTSSKTLLRQGIRATAANRSNMATLCSPNGLPVIENNTTSTLSARAAGYYWFEGIEMTACTGASAIFYNAVSFTMPTGLTEPAGPPADSTISGMPHDMVFSHSYIHGIPGTDNMIRGLYLDGYNFTVIDSTVNNWQASMQDSQGILVDCGTGGLLIQNNDIEASADSILIGAPECALVPGDLTIRHNYFTKQSSWYPQYILKNFVEFKNGQRILLTNNVMAYGIVAAQNGTGVVITPRTSTSPEAPGTWASVAQVSDVTITYNVIHDTGLGSETASTDSYCTPSMNCIASARTMYQNNLFYNLNSATGPNWCFQLDAPNELTLDHNTCLSQNTNAQSLFVDSYPNTNTWVTNNIFYQNVAGQGVLGPAAVALDSSYGNNSGAVIKNNGGYAPGWLTTTLNEWASCQCTVNTIYSLTIPFLNLTNYPVLPLSPFSKAGTDGKDLGWDATAVNIGNVVNGIMNRLTGN